MTSNLLRMAEVVLCTVIQHKNVNQLTSDNSSIFLVVLPMVQMIYCNNNSNKTQQPVPKKESIGTLRALLAATAPSVSRNA